MSQDDVYEKLAECRRRVDAVDVRLVALLNERTSVIEEIGWLKHYATLPVYEPKREDEVFRNIAESNQGPLTNEALRRVFERIIDEMRQIQKERMRDWKG